jgi:hypothetical protein
MKTSVPKLLLLLIAFSACGNRNDYAEVKFVSPRSLDFLELIRHFEQESWQPEIFSNCVVTGNDARAIIKGPGIPGGENVINIPGGIEVPSSFLTTASTVSLPPFSIFVPKGDGRVLGVSVLVEYSGGVCNPPGQQKRFFLSGWVGPLSVQSDMTVSLALSTTAHEMKIVQLETAPTNAWPVASGLRMVTLTGMPCVFFGGATFGATLRDLLHGGPPFPLTAASGSSSTLHIYPVAPNRSYVANYDCQGTTGGQVSFTTGPAGVNNQQTFNCTNTTPSTCTQN